MKAGSGPRGSWQLRDKATQVGHKWAGQEHGGRFSQLIIMLFVVRICSKYSVATCGQIYIALMYIQIKRDTITLACEVIMSFMRSNRCILFPDFISLSCFFSCVLVTFDFDLPDINLMVTTVHQYFIAWCFHICAMRENNNPLSKLKIHLTWNLLSLFFLELKQIHSVNKNQFFPQHNSVNSC